LEGRDTKMGLQLMKDIYMYAHTYTMPKSHQGSQGIVNVSKNGRYRANNFHYMYTFGVEESLGLDGNQYKIGYIQCSHKQSQAHPI